MSEYDFSDSVRNPYYDRLKKQVSIKMKVSTIDYFKDMASRLGVPYQTLINLFLNECAEKKLQISVDLPK